MGMGYGANYADVVEEPFIASICKKEFDDFKNAFSEWETMEEEIEEEDLQDLDFLELFEYGEYHRVKDCSNVKLSVLCKTYDILLKTFYEKTNGLSLYYRIHDKEDNGDRYDEVDGFFWEVSEVYKYTDAGEKYKEFIKRCFYVTYG
jgi:hypothetical protein